MEPKQQNPYDFILEETPAKKGFKLDTGSKKQRIIILAVGALVLVALALIIFSLLGNTGKQDTNQLYQISASQKDLIELTGLGSKDARASALIDQSTTAGIILTGQDKDTTEYIEGLKIKNFAKKISTLRNDNFVKLLAEASKNGNYDDTYKALYSNRLDEYSSLLNKTYSASNNKKLKALLAKFFSQLEPISGRLTDNN